MSSYMETFRAKHTGLRSSQSSEALLLTFDNVHTNDHMSLGMDWPLAEALHKELGSALTAKTEADRELAAEAI